MVLAYALRVVVLLIVRLASVSSLGFFVLPELMGKTKRWYMYSCTLFSDFL
jgi:hypothetical protein